MLTLIEAVKGLDVLLRIVGDGPARQQYEAYVRTKRIGNVVFEGYKTGDELKQLFRSALFHVIPSLCYENAPITILEAFAFGKPVIGSRLGGIKEMVREGSTGLLFSPGDPG